MRTPFTQNPCVRKDNIISELPVRMQYADTITIITGILTPLYVEKLIESYKGVKHKIVSTWKPSTHSYKILLHDLKSNGFKIVLSDYPKYRSGINYQIVCLQNGIKMAIELGYKYVCRSRTDIFPVNHIKFLEVTRDLYMEKLTALCGVSLPSKDFFLDIIMCGSCEQISALWSKLEEPTTHYKNAELFLLENYAKCNIETQEDVKKYISFSKNRCIESNIEIIWYRPDGIHFFPTTSPYVKLISEYCNAPFVYD